MTCFGVLESDECGSVWRLYQLSHEPFFDFGLARNVVDIVVAEFWYESCSMNHVVLRT